MEKYEYVSLILKPIEITLKTYGNYVYFTNPWKTFINYIIKIIIL